MSNIVRIDKLLYCIYYSSSVRFIKVRCEYNTNRPLGYPLLNIQIDKYIYLFMSDSRMNCVILSISANS